MIACGRYGNGVSLDTIRRASGAAIVESLTLARNRSRGQPDAQRSGHYRDRSQYDRHTPILEALETRGMEARDEKKACLLRCRSLKRDGSSIP